MANATATGVMTGAELRSTRELLGFSPTWISRHLGIAEREYVLMERGRSPVYKPIARKIETLAIEASDLVDGLIDKAEEDLNKGGKSVLHTYETDADYEFAQRSQGLSLEDQKPVRWHHHICARVADEVDVKIEYVSVETTGG